MPIPKDVLLDLLPVYLSGEARAGTRELLQERLAADPELSRIAVEMKTLQIPDTPRVSAVSHEMKAFARTKRLMFQRVLFMTLAVVFTLLFAFSMGFLLDSQPQAGAVSFLLTAIFWGVYAVNEWRMSRQ